MKSTLLYLHLFVIVLIAICSAISEETNWQQIGLNDQPVKHLLFYGDSNFLAGSSKGLYLFSNNRWYSYEGMQNIAITGMAFIGSGDLVVISGDGKETDGIYIGRAVINGPPFFQFKKKSYFSKPQALAVQGVNMGTLYIGSGNTVVYSAYTIEDPLSFDTIPLPPQCFGNKEPYCSSITIFNWLLGDVIFAGGYDEPGSESELIRYFENQIDSLLPLSISTIAYDYYSGNSSDIYFATRDSQVYYYGYYSSARNPQPLTKSPNNEMIFHIQPVMAPTLGDTLFVAVESGVYYKYSKGNDTWEKIGQIPVIPYSVLVDKTVKRRRVIAGTEMGVYIYDTISTGAFYTHTQIPHNTVQVNFRNNREFVIYPTSINEKKCSVKMYNCKGIKLYDSYVYIRENHPVLCRLSNPVVNGIYYVQFVYGSNCEIIKLLYGSSK